jgi:hypothetical protein
MRTTLRRLTLASFVLLFAPTVCPAARPDPSIASARPDPATVQRFGPAYRYPRAGWIVVHIEGRPYERGYQHGRLLAPEIADYVNTLATKRSHDAPAEAWRETRTMTNALFLRGYDREYLEEMKGIADGAAAAGASFHGRPIDLLDVVTVNSDIELEFLDSALQATATGLEGRTFKEPADLAPAAPHPQHCIAVAANGPATADGKIVFGHITMFSLHFVRHFNVWLDVKPDRGHRVLMQTYPGGIQSGMDYYLNDAGLLVAETTIQQTKFDVKGTPLASRIRKVLQYADSIDRAVEILKTDNNGMYTNEWLLADTKSNEIAMFELGTHRSKLWRSSKDEWFGGTKGFYWGCNNAKDLNVRLETVPSPDGRPANLVFRPSDRDRTWLRLYDEHKGTISEAFGFKAFTTPPLAAAHSLDAKFTTTEMARELKTWALFGPPLGKTWEPSEAERKRLLEVQPLVSNDWTILTADPPSPAENSMPVVGTDAQPDRSQVEKRIALLEKTRNDQLIEAVKQRTIGATTVETIGATSAGSLYALRDLARAESVLDKTDSTLAQLRSQLKNRKAVDLGNPSGPASDSKDAEADDEDEPERPRPHPAAWHGTVLPKADADSWLAAGFADFEKIVARELAIRKKAAAKIRQLTRAEKDELGVAVFAPYSGYRTAVARLGKDVPLAETRADLTSDDWYHLAAGKGVLLLAALREQLGDDSFLKLMDDFGRAHAGQTASTADFQAVAEEASGQDLKPFFREWLTGTDLPGRSRGGFWSIGSFEAELDRAVIVYGTLKESDAQREAAGRLQRQIERKWSNFTVPILADRDATPEALKGRHVLLVGRPDSNSAAPALARALPLTFGPASFSIRDETYAHPHTAVIAAGPIPDDHRYEVVIFAGLSAEATWRCVLGIGERNSAPAEVVLLPAGKPAQRLAVGPADATDRTASK